MTMDRADLNFTAGTRMIGKWHGKTYHLLRKLGSGAQGTVYLAVSGKQKKVAVKLARDRASLISEINVLKTFQSFPGTPPGPELYDSDDWVIPGRETIAFCVMEYLSGEPLDRALKRKPFEWVTVFLIQLLGQLQNLHSRGYIFGDLKPENLILIDPGYSLRCLDFGGATRLGRSVREYTEFYDRGYWGLGTRKADPGYDLFACAMIMIYAALGRRINRNGQPDQQLFRVIESNPKLFPFKKVLYSALNSRYDSAGRMRSELMQQIMEISRAGQPRKLQRKKKESPAGEWIRAGFSAALMVTIYVICVILYVL